MWTHQYLNDEKKKAKTKKNNDGIYDNMKKEEPNKREETGALVDGVVEPNPLHQSSNQDDEDDDYIDDEYIPKKKFEIVDLRKKLSFRRKTGKVPKKALDKDWEHKTEEDKINDAKKHLAWLQEKQKRNIIVDFFGVPKMNPNKIEIEPSTDPDNNEASGSLDSIFWYCA